MELNDLIYKIRSCIFKEYPTLDPELLESVYEAALAYELCKSDLTIQIQVFLSANYDDRKPELGFRSDILVEVLQEVHKKQLPVYLKLPGKKLE